MRLSYFPSGFTVGAVLANDFREVSEPEGAAPTLDGNHPEKTAVHVEVCVSFPFPNLYLDSPVTIVFSCSSATPHME